MPFRGGGLSLERLVPSEIHMLYAIQYLFLTPINLILYCCVVLSPLRAKWRRSIHRRSESIPPFYF